jgi:hypothetical protein
MPMNITISDTVIDNIKNYYKENNLPTIKKSEMEKVINNMLKEHIYDLECAKDILSESNEDDENCIDLGSDEDDLKGIMGRA